MSRYGRKIKKPVIDGHRFDSGKEAARYQDLKLLAAAGEISNLEIQVALPIVIGGVEIRYQSGRLMKYIADFRYQNTAGGETVIEDVKMESGHRTDSYRIKRALVAAMGIEILET